MMSLIWSAIGIALCGFLLAAGINYMPPGAVLRLETADTVRAGLTSLGAAWRAHRIGHGEAPATLDELRVEGGLPRLPLGTDTDPFEWRYGTHDEGYYVCLVGEAARNEIVEGINRGVEQVSLGQTLVGAACPDGTMPTGARPVSVVYWIACPPMGCP